MRQPPVSEKKLIFGFSEVNQYNTHHKLQICLNISADFVSTTAKTNYVIFEILFQHGRESFNLSLSTENLQR